MSNERCSVLFLTFFILFLFPPSAFSEYCEGEPNWVLCAAFVCDNFTTGIHPDALHPNTYVNLDMGGYVATQAGASSCQSGLANKWNSVHCSTCEPRPESDCSEKEGTTAGYNIATYREGSFPNLANQCVGECEASAEVYQSLGPCVESQCIVSLKYTFTGNLCGTGEDGIPLEEEPPSQCHAEWIALVNKCGSASNVGHFDWSTCSGECSQQDCSSEWSALASRCGGESYIVNWNGTTCTGTCKSDDLPSVTDGDASPKSIDTTTTNNSDGTSSTTTNTTYTIGDTTYTNSTTKTYDSSGNETGSSTSTSQSPNDSSDDEPSYDMPSSWYTKTYDISNGLASAVDYQQVINATESFKNTALYQVPNLILECLGYVKGVGCEYPPVLSVDFHNRFSSKPIEVDLSPFVSVVKIMKFFFSILCIIGTGKAVMALFN